MFWFAPANKADEPEPRADSKATAETTPTYRQTGEDPRPESDSAGILNRLEGGGAGGVAPGL